MHDTQPCCARQKILVADQLEERKLHCGRREPDRNVFLCHCRNIGVAETKAGADGDEKKSKKAQYMEKIKKRLHQGLC